MNHNPKHNESLINALLKNVFNINIPGKELKIYIIFIVVICTVAIYFNSLNNNFVSLDDNVYVYNNYLFNNSLSDNLAYFFTNQYNGHYHPLTMLSYAFQYKYSGLNATLYHLFNLVFHILSVVIVFYIVYSFIRRIDIAAVVTLLFGIHPMNIEAVSWISARGSVMYSFFYLTALLCYIYYLNSNGKLKYLIFSLILFILSMLSKSAAVTLPILFICIDIYYKRKYDKRTVLEKIPFFLLSVVFGMIALYSAREFGSLFMAEDKYSGFDRLFMLSYSIVFYLKNFFYPSGFTAMHFNPSKTDGMLPFEYYIAPFIIIIIIGIIVFSKRSRKNMVFGLVFFLISLSVFLQVLPVGNTIFSERYAYVPYIGLFIIMGNYINTIRNLKIKSYSIAKKYLYFILMIYIMFLSFTAWKRNEVWKNSVTLYSDMIKRYPNDYYGYYGLGNARIAEKKYNEALNNYNKALDLKQNAKSFHARGVVNKYLKRVDHAIADYNMAIKLDPYLIEAYYNRAILYFELQNYNLSLSDYNMAIKFKPLFAKAYNNRGNTKFMMNDKTGACNDWQKALELGYMDAGKVISKYCK